MTVISGPSTPQAAQPASTVLRHIILFTMWDNTTSEITDEAMRLMEAMCQTPLVIRYELAVSMDTRKGTILIENIDFAGEEDFEAFKATAGHQAFANFIREHADWKIADYIVSV